MWIFIWGKWLLGAHIGATPIKEIYLWTTKVRPEGTPINLNLENWQPIWRLHDWELWFRVNVKDASEPFKMAIGSTNWTSYDRDISVDWATPMRYHGDVSQESLSISLPAGKHYIKITPHGELTAGWARCIGINEDAEELPRNSDSSKIEFWLERIPWYAFMKSEDTVGDNFLYYAFAYCTSLTSMPNWFSLPQNVTSVGDNFMLWTWSDCTEIRSIPGTFSIPEHIVSVWTDYLNFCWSSCSNLESIWEWFDIWSGIKNIWSGFLSTVRKSCTSLTSMPKWFNIPKGIKEVKEKFMFQTWANCTSLITMPEGFNLPKGITKAKNNFLWYTREKCTSLTAMPKWFNIPQGITEWKDYFVSWTRSWCSSLAALPEGFKLPETLSSVWPYSLYLTWYNCSALTSDSPAELFTFPTLDTVWFGQECFWGSCPIELEEPVSWKSVMIKR